MNLKFLKDRRFLLVLIVIVLCFLGWGIYKLVYKYREDSFFTTGNDVSNQNSKLMIVDQNTGQISFVNRSLAQLNTAFTSEDTTITNSIQALEAKVNSLETDMQKLLGSDRAGQGIPSSLAMSGKDGIIRKLNDAINGKLDEKLDKPASGNYVLQKDAILNKDRILIKIWNPKGKSIAQATNSREYFWHVLHDGGCDGQYGHNDPAKWCAKDSATHTMMYIQKNDYTASGEKDPDWDKAIN